MDDWRLVDQDRAATETRWVEEVAQGSEEALGRLYDRYARLLFSLVLAILKDARDAEEILQDVFLQVWRQAHRFERRRGRVYKWLITLARSRAIDRLRSKNYTHHQKAAAAEPDLTDSLEGGQTSQLDAVVVLERSMAVQGILDRLPREQRRVLELGYFHGHSQSEIARHLELPLGTVKSRMRLGLASMRNLLNEELSS